MKTLFAALLSFCAAIAIPSASSATFKTAPVLLVPKGESITEDLFAAASKARIETETNGDLAAAAIQTVQVSAPVQGYVFLIGQNLDLGGSVRNDAWLIGQNSTVRSRVFDNVYAAGATVVLADKSLVERDVFIAGGTVSLNGTIGRNARIIARTLIIKGKVLGSVYAKANEIRILDRAIIRGNFYYQSPNRLWQSPKAKVTGRIEHRVPPKENARSGFWSRLARWLRQLVAAIVFGAVLLATIPRPVTKAAEAVAKSFWKSLGVGLVAAIVLPIASVLAMITIIGIPLGLASLAAYAVMLYASGLFVALALGRRLVERLGAQLSSVSLLACGAVLLAVVYEVPLFGCVVKLAVTLVGLGAFCSTLWSAQPWKQKSNEPHSAAS